MLIVADDKIPFLKGVLEPFSDIEYYEGNKITHDVVRNADALVVRTRTKCDAALLEGSRVQFIATATIGFDHIDLEYCQKKGIIWSNAAGCNSGSVMQYLAAGLLTYAKGKNINLQNHVLGVIGAGNVGKKVVRLAECIGMQVVINDPPRARKEGPCGFVSLEGIFRESDIITLHVPLNHIGEDCSYHMVDEKFLSGINKGTMLINTSRGEVVDTLALKSSLFNKKLDAVILDVWENEPNIDKELLGSAFIGTPHIAGYSIDGKSNATAMVVNAVSKYFNFGIDGWETSNLPEPDNRFIGYNAANKNLQEIFTDLVHLTYQIRNDDKSLRDAPDNFEYLRGNYPIRREFGAYQINALNLQKEDKNMLIKAGFKFF